MNYLEQLVAEWYEFQGYFIRRNVLVDKRERGGYDCELDVVAFHPVERRLVQVEPSMDADSWARREQRFSRKFAAGRRVIPELFKGFPLPKEVDQIALLVFASKTNHPTVGGGRVMLVPELLRAILDGVGTKPVVSEMVPEQFPLLRTLQFVGQYRTPLAEVLCPKEV